MWPHGATGWHAMGGLVLWVEGAGGEYGSQQWGGQRVMSKGGNECESVLFDLQILDLIGCFLVGCFQLSVFWQHICWLNAYKWYQEIQKKKASKTLVHKKAKLKITLFESHRLFAGACPAHCPTGSRFNTCLKLLLSQERRSCDTMHCGTRRLLGGYGHWLRSKEG